MIRLRRQRVILIATLFSLLLLPCCTGGGAQEAAQTSGQNDLALLQQNKFIKASLFGIMTFSFSDDTFTWPTELAVSSVPIVWMGQVFNGQVKNAGPAKDITDQVHGGVSADGQWLLSFYFSRVISSPNNPAMYYTVELKNVPIGTLTGTAQGARGSITRQGDIQKYITSLVYMSPGAIYLSTDWTNDADGQRANLEVVFEKDPSELLGDLPAGGMM